MDLVVQIIESATGKVVKQIGPLSSIRKAERVEEGVLINLNHDRFETRIVEHTPSQSGNQK